MKKLDFYILRELAVPVVSATLIVAFLFAGNEMIALFQQLNTSNVPFMTVLKLAFLNMPLWLTLTLPVGMAMGCSLAVSRLTREGELTAMRAAGIPIWRVLLMVGIAGVVMAGLTYWDSEYVAPKANKEHEKLSMEALVVSGLPNLATNQMIRLNPWTVSMREIQRLGNEKLALSDVLMVRWLSLDEAVVFKCPTGVYDKGKWSFNNGTMWRFKGNSLTSVSDAESIALNQDFSIRDLFPSSSDDHKSVEELWAQVESLKAAGLNSNGAETKFYERFSIPAACLVFAIAASVISIRFSKASAFQGLMLSLVMALVYYNAHMIATTIVGPNGWLPPMIAVWSPVVVFGVVALVAGRRLE